MEAIREIVEVKEGKVTLQLPESFTAKRVELIVLPAEETSPLLRNRKSQSEGQACQKE